MNNRRKDRYYDIANLRLMFCKQSQVHMKRILVAAFLTAVGAPLMGQSWPNLRDGGGTLRDKQFPTTKRDFPGLDQNFKMPPPKSLPPLPSTPTKGGGPSDYRWFEGWQADVPNKKRSDDAAGAPLMDEGWPNLEEAGNVLRAKPFSDMDPNFHGLKTPPHPLPPTPKPNGPSDLGPKVLPRTPGPGEIPDNNKDHSQ